MSAYATRTTGMKQYVQPVLCSKKKVELIVTFITVSICLILNERCGESMLLVRGSSRRRRDSAAATLRNRTRNRLHCLYFIPVYIFEKDCTLKAAPAEILALEISTSFGGFRDGKLIGRDETA
ncbi:hypothetical protein Y032_0002g702 [Ancylostoma ceylanicum]|uniref:Uncharacterized protein n=1 Tax=Ancylostoma ceylanicum TaxID=53326 RepID=A0A016W2Q4_9BILA|nr:hypothetical protein Y032_0002g702 [Ancylostoma ceylanicum]